MIYASRPKDEEGLWIELRYKDGTTDEAVLPYLDLLKLNAAGDFMVSICDAKKPNASRRTVAIERSRLSSVRVLGCMGVGINDARVQPRLPARRRDQR